MVIRQGAGHRKQVLIETRSQRPKRLHFTIIATTASFSGGASEKSGIELSNPTMSGDYRRPFLAAAIPLREVLKFVALLSLVCAVTVAVSMTLPAPDSTLFAVAVLFPAIALALIICIELSEGRINGVGDIMHAIETRRAPRLTISAYLLGCSLVAAMLVLLYNGFVRPL
jgi:hypothetical protein